MRVIKTLPDFLRADNTKTLLLLQSTTASRLMDSVEVGRKVVNSKLAAASDCTLSIVVVEKVQEETSV